MTNKQAILDANIPREDISTREQGGAKLSYLEGWYVIDRLNQILGSDKWSHTIISMSEVQGSEKKAFICHVRLTADIDGSSTTKDGIGYGIDKYKFNPGEMAVKEAETDALKRAAMKLGRSLGLALYDKTQEFVDDKPQNTRDVPVPEKKTSPKGDSEVLRKQIKSAFSVLQAQKKIDKDAFVKDYLEGAKVDDLTDIRILEVIRKLKTNFKELGL